MKIFVAVPVYDARLHLQTIRCLLNEQIMAIANGDIISFNFVSGNAGIVQARNQLATEFLHSDADRLFFLDADVTFEPGAIVNLCRKPVDVVGGCYRLKRDEERYPIAWKRDGKNLMWDENKLLEVEGVPTGFLSISRNALETLLKKHPDRNLTLQCGVEAYCFFQQPYVDGHLYGEDFYFCREWSEAGGKIYLDPEIHLTHWDFNPKPIPGHIGNWLKSMPSEQVKGPENVLP